MNPDKDLFDLLIELIEKVLGHPVSPLFEKALAAFFILAIIAIGANALILGIKALINEVIIPVFYNKEQKRRRSRRQLFADHVEAEIRYLNSRESWNDNRFAELEAEVEAEGSRRVFGWIKINFGAGTRLRREKSLSTAISNSAVPLVLLEGDPGSGKSVALRHVAQQMARRAAKSRSLKSVVPLYVNLKNLKRDGGQTVDRNFIGDFVLRSINRINDRDVDEFLKDEFQIGLEEGSWFFLFDSFDEIPEILSSTESDTTIRAYAEALRDFLHGMNKCKGIVASREYKGPRYLGWPKFRIAPLSSKRRRELIRLTNLPAAIQESIYAGISFATTEFRTMTSNPMFLSLLCEYMQKPNIEFPQYTHLVFDEYILKRIMRDEERLMVRFGKKPLELRSAAEKLAFCMTADAGLGLSPTLDSLSSSTEKLGLSLGQDFDIYVEALEYLKLARIDKQLGEQEKLFTFAHRRFQEYFATAIVVKEPSRITTKELLFNAQWRETAVTLLQTQSTEQLVDIMMVSEKIFGDALEQMGDRFDSFELELDIPEKRSTLFESLLERLKIGLLSLRLFEHPKITKTWMENLSEEFDRQKEEKGKKRDKVEAFNLPISWPSNMYHLLSILQDGRAGKSELLPETFQTLIDKFICFIVETGSLDDKKMAVEVAGVASKEKFIHIIKKGFYSTGNWIKASAYRQLARLGELPPEFAKFIRATLVSLMFNGRLFVDRQEVYAQLSRLDKSRQYVTFVRLLVWMPIIDYFLVAISMLIAWVVFVQGAFYWFAFLAISYLLLRWHATPLWQSGVNSSSSDFYYHWLRTPHGYAFIAISLIAFSSICSQFGLFIYSDYVNPPSQSQSTSSSWTISAILALLLFLFSLNTWSSIASAEAMGGKRTHPMWWFLYLAYPFVAILLLPLLLIWEILLILFVFGDGVFILSRLLYIIRVVIERRSGTRVEFVWYFASNFHSIGLVLVSLVVMILFSLTNNAQFVNSDLIMVYVFEGIAIFAGIFLLLPTINFVNNFIKKYIEMRELRMHPLPNSKTDLVFLLEYLANFKQKDVRVKILKDIINCQLLVSNRENEERLRKLIAFVQAIVARNLPGYYEFIKEQDPVLASSLKISDIEKHPKLVPWNNEQLDELCNLLDQIRTGIIVS